MTAVGVHVSARYVTTHGWATNVATDLTDFAGIVPCGIADKQVTSLAALGRGDVDADDVAATTTQALAGLLDAPVREVTPEDLGLVPARAPV